MNTFKHKAFTLIELLIVIAIIGVLASIVFSSLNTARTKARNAKYRSQALEITKAIRLYYNDTGQYPISIGWLSNSGNALEAVLHPQYMSNSVFHPNSAEPGFDSNGLLNRSLYMRCADGNGFGLFYRVDSPITADTQDINRFFESDKCQGVTYWDNYTGLVTVRGMNAVFFEHN
jgi:prepilin-type N-terminal cleavage/methylation domain-containing protein